jgi:hypothetical protein
VNRTGPSAGREAEPSPAGELRPDYGIDAPGIRRGMFLAGGAGLALATAAAALGLGATWTAACLVVAGYGGFMGGYMTYGSRVGKLKTRDRLLDRVAKLRPWTGSDSVLDVGCGRGLMLVGAARRLHDGAAPRAPAIGIDLWRTEDQTHNTPEAALRNAQIEGVAHRVRIDTGDARALPYADDSFDVVLSHWVVHNLEEASDRLRVLDEMWRVLRPGGVLALADIAFVLAYREHFSALGASPIQCLDGGLEARLMGLLSGGSYRPQALLAVKPVNPATPQP